MLARRALASGRSEDENASSADAKLVRKQLRRLRCNIARRCEKLTCLEDGAIYFSR